MTPTLFGGQGDARPGGRRSVPVRVLPGALWPAQAGYSAAPVKPCPRCGSTDAPPVGTPGVNGHIYSCHACSAIFTERGAYVDRRRPAQATRETEHDAERVPARTGQGGPLFGARGPAAAMHGPARASAAMPPEMLRPCRLCGESIRFLVTIAGKRMPVDARLHWGDGRRTLVTLDGRVVPHAAAEVQGHEPHFGTCPAYRAAQQAERERRRQAGGESGRGETGP